jgi:hypothetical protein
VFQQRKVTRAGDLASGPMLGLGNRPHERIGQGPSWVDDRVSTQRQKKIERAFQFSKPFYKSNLIWIRIEFKFSNDSSSQNKKQQYPLIQKEICSGMNATNIIIYLNN